MIASFSIYPYTIVNGHTCRQQPSNFSHSQGDGSSRSESDGRVHSITSKATQEPRTGLDTSATPPQPPLHTAHCTNETDGFSV